MRYWQPNYSGALHDLLCQFAGLSRGQHVHLPTLIDCDAYGSPNAIVMRKIGMRNHAKPENRFFWVAFFAVCFH
jgi:hypothetical protein